MIHVRPARVVDLPGVAAVLQEAFSDKLRAIFSRQPEKVRTLLEAVYTGPVQRGYDGLLVADYDGRVIGTLIIDPIFYTPEENRTFEHFAVRELGLPRMLWASFLLWLIGHTPENGEAYISDVGVEPDYQGEGVGQMLMDEAEQWALNHDRQRLTLWVAQSNARALRLYERSGFEVVDTRASLLTRMFFGIRHWYFMEKPLDNLD
jgi:ribosomal protein S18 acetylase RimI-like enzyme